MHNLHAIENLPNMPVLEALKQPAEVWRCVEREALRHWRFTCKEAMGFTAGEAIPDMWLTPALLEPLLARDVPVLRLFWGCAMRERFRLSDASEAERAGAEGGRDG